MAPRWPLPGWKPVEPFPFAGAARPFKGPARDHEMLWLEYFVKPDGGLVGVASFGPASEGAPGQAHGGAILTALDEALGAAAWHAGHRVLTARLSTEFRKSVPVGAHLLVETRIKARRHRLVVVAGTLQGEDGEIYAGAEGRFVELAPEHDRRIFGS